MNNLIKSFEEKLEAILTMKKDKEMERNDYVSYFHYVLSFIIIITIFTLVGYFLNLSSNGTYIISTVNIAIIGSFIFGRYQQEERYQKKHNVNYSINIAMTTDILRTSIISFAVSFMLILYVYRPVVSNLFALIVLILSTLCLITYTLISEAMKDYKPYKLRSISFDIILIHQIMIIGFFNHVFSNILINTVFFTTLLIPLLIIKDITKKRDVKIIANPLFKAIFYVVLVSLGQHYDTKLSYTHDVEDAFIYRAANNTLYKELLFENANGDNPVMYYTFYNNEYIYISTKTDLLIYSLDYTLLTNLPIEEDTKVKVVFDGNKTYLYKYTKYNEPGDEHHYDYIHTLYLLNEDFEEELIFETDLKDDGFYKILIKEDEYYFIGEENLIQYLPETNGYKNIESTDRVQLMNDTEIYLSNEGYITSSLDYYEQIAYSNGYILVQSSENHTVNIYTVEDYTTVRQNPITIEGVDTTKITGDLKDITDFLATENGFLLKNALDAVAYDKKGNELSRTTFLNFGGFDTAHVTGDLVTTITQHNGVSYFEENGMYYVNQIDISDLSDYEFRSEYTTYWTCDNPFGCDDYMPMFTPAFTDYVLLGLIVLLILPTRKTSYLSKKYNIN